MASKCYQQARYVVQAAAQRMPVLEDVVGLEIHVQLNTKSKLFSRAPAASSLQQASNQYVALFDMGTPGTLPRLNRKCVELAIRGAVLLNCEVAKECRFDRKHYFYPDMPTGYQITQNELPIARNGYFKYYLRSGNYTPLLPEHIRTATIKQIQLEMDSGKIIHDKNEDLIDLNRAGIGLIEIVTEPCFQGPIDASTFVENLRWALINNNISNCEMHRGQLRVDANVSVTKDGKPGVKTEIKNINSFRDIESALTFETRRHRQLIAEGKEVVEETRGVHQGKTYSQRGKGDQHDYRFLPEPNLPRLKIRQEWIDEANRDLQRNEHPFSYVDQHGLSVDYSFMIMYEPQLKRFLDTALTIIRSTGKQAEPILRELPKIITDLGHDFPPQNDLLLHIYCELVDLYVSKKLTRLVFIDLAKFYNADEQNQSVSVVKKIETDELWAIMEPEKVEEEVVRLLKQVPEKLVVNARTKPQPKHFTRVRNQIIADGRRRIPVELVESALRELLAQ